MNQEVEEITAYKCPACDSLHEYREAAESCCPLIENAGLAMDYILKGGQVIDGEGKRWVADNGLVPGKFCHAVPPYRKYN
jgi:hypothetical protein